MTYDHPHHLPAVRYHLSGRPLPRLHALSGHSRLPDPRPLDRHSQRRQSPASRYGRAQDSRHQAARNAMSLTVVPKVRVYLDEDVYTAAKARLHTIYDIYDSVLVSFSGGKDSL